MNKKILVVEDELSYLKIFNSQLTEKGYEVVEAKNGKEGLELAKSFKPDLILLDIKMPVMDGLTMLDQLRQEVNGHDFQVILLTNIEPDEKIIDSVLRDKPACYLIKSDISLSELMAKVTEILGDE